MNLLVVAPTETVVVHPVYNQIPDGPQYEHGVNKVTRDENGNPDKISTRGGWNIYYKGMLVETFDGHSKPIFNNPEKIIEKYEKIYNERTNQQ